MIAETKPCPCCDVETNELDPIGALAYGVTVGVIFSVLYPNHREAMHRVTERMCEKHRVQYMTSAMRVAEVLR